MKKLTNYIKGGAIALALFFAVGYSASKHLEIAYKKDPSLFTTTVDTVQVEVPRIDTVFQTERDTIQIALDIDSIIRATVSDSCQDEVKKIIVPITEYVKDSKCFDDTLLINRPIFFLNSETMDTIGIGQIHIRITNPNDRALDVVWLIDNLEFTAGTTTNITMPDKRYEFLKLVRSILVLLLLLAIVILILKYKFK